MTLSKKHTVTGIIIDSIQYLPESLRPTGEIATKMNRFALRLIQSNLILCKTAARLVTDLKEKGINGVLLKGLGIASYYRDPQMRQSGDIDFYVGKRQYDKAVGICSRKSVGDKNKCYADKKHFSLYINSVEVELHRLAAIMYSPVRNRRFQEWIVGELEDPCTHRVLRLGNTDVSLPSYDFDALFIFYHAWFHFITGGIGLRQLCDWSMLFHSHGTEIDHERLKNNLRNFGLTKGWKLFACIAVNHLGVPENRIPLYDPGYSTKAEKIMEEIIDGGNFGYYSESMAKFLSKGNGIIHELRKFPAITRYFLSLFPIIPTEATLIFFNRLFSGTITYIKTTFGRLLQMPKN